MLIRTVYTRLRSRCDLVLQNVALRNELRVLQRTRQRVANKEVTQAEHGAAVEFGNPRVYAAAQSELSPARRASCPQRATIHPDPEV